MSSGGVHSTRGRTKSSIYVRSNGSNSNEDRKRDVDVPASTTILTSEDLKATGAQNLQVALGRVPGLIYKTFAPGGGAMGTMANEIAIRGVSNGTLIMLNGSPMNLRGKYF